jgi:nucleoid-associated protein YgaU
MANPAFDVDQALKHLASQSIKQGRDVRTAVRSLTLKALQQRELTLEQTGKVLRSVTEGVTLGVAKRATAKSAKRAPAKTAKRPAAKTAKRPAVRTAKRAKSTATRKLR